ncbi:hypothetical protein [Sphingomonas sp. Y38-1Y]|uniref:hypothetical protein n=1 Tax=Sphingomonas sp. Y38-1Y TaxID=3078265 RepID=UPI0028E9B3A9|nr:hypothetical protein [Sphingomonas sp. Y38-1Y]
MARLFTAEQAAQNRRFLTELAKGGNVRLAARAVGIADATMHRRRREHPVFATKWDAALVAAQARLNRQGPHRPEAKPPSGRAARAAREHRTQGGEPVIVSLANGKLQLRASQAGKLTRAAEQAFLLALAATCNVRLSAAAAGAAEAPFYRRRRCDPGFAREWEAAEKEGYERLEAALIEGFQPWDHEHAEWSHNERPAMPAMTTYQAMALLYLHDKRIRDPEPRAIKYDSLGRYSRLNKPAEVRAAQYVEDRARQADAILRSHVEWKLGMALDKIVGRPEGAGPTIAPLDLVVEWEKAGKRG